MAGQSERHVAVLTVGRSDVGRVLQVLYRLRDEPTARLSVLAGGNHFDPRFGNTVDEIIEYGFDPIRGLSVAVDTDAPHEVGRAIGEGTRLLSEYFEKDRPDILVVLGDRYEVLSGPCAAMGFNIPVAHIYGGAVTEGAIDELARHAITKMSHIHMVACELYAQRVRQMGEEPWRVHNTGAPSLDGIDQLADFSVDDMSGQVELDLTVEYLLVCFHPVTLEADQTADQFDSLLAALDEFSGNLILTYPNVDVGHDIVIDKLNAFASANRSRARLIKNAGNRLFLSLMKHAAAVVGNSSAGILESTAFETPSINIGSRQDGKIHGQNVIDTGYETASISAALKRIDGGDFKRSLRGMTKPYGDGNASAKIADILTNLEIDQKLLRKRFCLVSQEYP